MQVGESSDVSHSQNGLGFMSIKGPKLWSTPTEKEILVSMLSPKFHCKSNCYETKTNGSRNLKSVRMSIFNLECEINNRKQTILENKIQIFMLCSLRAYVFPTLDTNNLFMQMTTTLFYFIWLFWLDGPLGGYILHIHSISNKFVGRYY
jgi:hypothetical protein